MDQTGSIVIQVDSANSTAYLCVVLSCIQYYQSCSFSYCALCDENDCFLNTCI